MLLGRAGEVGRIEVLLRAAARERLSAGLIVHGEPGVGKTRLLEQCAEAAAGFTVLRALPLEAESELAFAGLFDLLRPITHLLDSLPERQRAALAGALALGPPAPGDRFGVAAATLSLLAAAAEDAPLLALVDDAQWLDAASREALLFAARRLANEGVVLVFGMREREWLRTAGITTLELGGLAAADATTLIDRMGVGIDPAVRSRVVSESQGNPLAILSALDQLSTEQLRGSAPIAHPLPVGAELETSFAQLLDGVPGRRALLIAAVSDTGASDEILRALAAADLSRADFEPAERVGLITVGAERVEFRHPLIRAAAYHRHDPVERREAHRAYATALGPDPRAAWHLAAATAGPDEAVAAGLEAAAENALARSGYTAAGRAYESAAALSEDDHERLRRSLAAGRALWLGGEPERAAKLLESVLELATDPLARADLQALRGAAQLFLRPPKETYDLFVTEAERVLPHDRARAAGMYAHAALISFPRGRVDDARQCAQRGVAADGGPPGSVSALLLGCAHANHGDVAEARRWLEPQIAMLTAADPLGDGGQLISAAAQAFAWIGDWDTADTAFRRIIATARAAGAPSVLPLALSQMAEFELRRGRVAASYAAASESVQLATEFGLAVESSFSLVTLARVEAVLGREPACREHVAAATDYGRRTGAIAIECYCGGVLGLLELACGRPDRAVAPMRESRRLERAMGAGLSSITQWAADLVEALARSGATAEAHAELVRLEAEAERTSVPWVRAVAARCRGLLAGDDFETPFAVALAFTEMPFERARSQLSLGMRRRRAGRRADARAALQEALDYFEAAGAEPWAEQARAELGAAGAPSVPHADSSLRALTPQELQVSLSVATGITNREVAAALFLSEKTVEFHLSNVYRKLDLRSRTQLTRRIAGLP